MESLEENGPFHPSAPMRSDFTALDLQTFEIDLGEALLSRLRWEGSQLGLRLRTPQLKTLSSRLLGSPGLEERLSGAARPWKPEAAFEPHDYLPLVPQEIRRSLGQYMTPSPIARYILRASGYRAEEGILAKKLCDPACGSGVFLVESLRTYLQALNEAGVPIDQWYPKVAASVLGIDVDPIACLYARFNLSVVLAPAVLSWMNANPRRSPEPLPIFERDTLSSVAAEIEEPGILESPSPEPRLAGEFDLVVGNPPYRKLGQMSPELRRAFADSIYGHPNAYGMFLHAGIEMLRPGGRLGFIVPRSMLSGLYFQNLRRMIEESTWIEEVSVFADRKRVFSRVLQGTMILVFQKKGHAEREKEDRRVRAAVVRSIPELENGGPAHFLAAPSQVARRLNGTTVWFVSDRERTYSLLDKIVGRHPLLGSSAIACPARTGPIVWNRVKPLLRQGGGAGTLPLVWATDVGRFHFSFGSAGESRPAFLADNQETERLATLGPSLLVQRVTADEQARRIVASLTRLPGSRRYFVENHLNLLQPTPGTPVALEFLLGVLSSDVVEFMFRSMNGNTQVSATELNLLPIPRGKLESEIADLATRLEEAKPKQRQDLEQELNERVARAYGLTGSDLSFLQTALQENSVAGASRRDD
jgi:adenine-specific DNA-methyltransferase